MGTYVTEDSPDTCWGRWRYVDRIAGVVARDLMSSNRRIVIDDSSTALRLRCTVGNDGTGAMGLRIALATTVEASPSSLHVLRYAGSKGFWTSEL